MIWPLLGQKIIVVLNSCIKQETLHILFSNCGTQRTLGKTNTIRNLEQVNSVQKSSIPDANNGVLLFTPVTRSGSTNSL